jgi:hypothetical protein
MREERGTGPLPFSCKWSSDFFFIHYRNNSHYSKALCKRKLFFIKKMVSAPIKKMAEVNIPFKQDN